MNREFLLHLCKYFTITTGTAIRLYHKDKRLSIYSPFSLDPDPFSLYEEEMLKDTHTAAIFATELFQLYGQIRLKEDYSIAIGPSCILTDDEAGLGSQLFLLGVSEAESKEYCRKLYCMPSMSTERLVSYLVLLGTAIYQTPFSLEDIYIRNKPDFSKNPIPELSASKTLLEADDVDISDLIEKNYLFEKSILFYIQTGQPECLHEILFSNPHMARAGIMAKDTLRQLKNMGICAATIASRAAIEGGLSSQIAFGLSDLYIQQFELMKDATSIHNLTNEMLVEYAGRTQQIQYPYDTHSKLFQKCSHYISHNLFSPIKVNDIANALEVSRPYLCSHFKEKTGVTLSHYILTEKVNEAKRLLLFTDKSLSDISMLLAFSSQSHFQTVFKKITGKTPLSYRLSG